MRKNNEEDEGKGINKFVESWLSFTIMIFVMARWSSVVNLFETNN